MICHCLFCSTACGDTCMLASLTPRVLTVCAHVTRRHATLVLVVRPPSGGAWELNQGKTSSSCGRMGPRRKGPPGRRRHRPASARRVRAPRRLLAASCAPVPAPGFARRGLADQQWGAGRAPARCRANSCAPMPRSTQLKQTHAIMYKGLIQAPGAIKLATQQKAFGKGDGQIAFGMSPLHPHLLPCSSLQFRSVECISPRQSRNANCLRSDSQLHWRRFPHSWPRLFCSECIFIRQGRNANCLETNSSLHLRMLAPLRLSECSTLPQDQSSPVLWIHFRRPLLAS